MGVPLRILIVEDSEDDTFLITNLLERKGYAVAWQRVDDSASMSAALDQREWDIVISDHDMPCFSAFSALALLKDKGLDLPLIVVSGARGEEYAVAAIRAGAHDYITKDSLERLVPAIEREMREAAVRKQKRNEEALRKGKGCYYLHFQNVGDLVYSLDPEFNVTGISPSIEALTGYPPEEIIGRKFGCRNPLAPRDIVCASSDARRAPAGKRVAPVKYDPVFKDSTKTLAGKASTPQVNNGKIAAIVAVGRNIADRTRAEERILRSKLRYRPLIENLPDNIIELGLDGKILHAKRSFLGLEAGDMVGKSLLDYVPEQHHADLRKAMSHAENTGNACDFETSMGAPPEAPLENSGEDTWWSVRVVPMKARGEITKFLAIGVDITKRKKDEEARRELSEKLERTRRMEALGVLAGGVAHDLNNMLVPLLAYPDMIMGSLSEDDPLRSYAQKIKDSAETAAETVQDLLVMARRGRYDMEPLNLNDEIEACLRSEEFSELKAANPDVSVAVELDKDIMNIRASSSHLAKVIMNLIINAFDAMPGGGKLTVATSCEYVDRPFGRYDNVEKGDYVVLRIGDTGAGIEEHDLERIFEPFYSKKKMGRSGSGLGLSIVYGIVKDHDGYIDVLTEMGVGSEVVVYLPVTRELIREEEEAPDDYSGTETILVVDDAEQQREVASRLLSGLGYTVKTAENGLAAIEYLKNHRADLIVLDMIMEEGFDGLDTYRRVIEMHPSQKAIIVSGFSENGRVKEAQQLGSGRYVRKPYTLDKIGRAVREELDRK